MVLDLDVGILFLDIRNEGGEEGRTADSGHVLETDFVAAVFHDLVDDTHIVFNGMDRGIGYRKGDLGSHSRLLRILHAEPEVAVVIEPAEGAGDIRPLFMFHLEHELPDIGWYRIHSQGVESPLKHMGLNSCLMERGGPAADGDIRILTEKEVYLLESASVRLDAVETAHVYNGGGHLFQLIHPRNVFSGRLPHIPVNQGEFYFTLCHKKS